MAWLQQQQRVKSSKWKRVRSLSNRLAPHLYPRWSDQGAPISNPLRFPPTLHSAPSAAFACRSRRHDVSTIRSVCFFPSRHPPFACTNKTSRAFLPSSVLDRDDCTRGEIEWKKCAALSVRLKDWNTARATTAVLQEVHSMERVLSTLRTWLQRVYVCYMGVFYSTDDVRSNRDESLSRSRRTRNF